MIVGCDRVAANGDVANKVGTYGLALAARAAGVPFVVAGPVSTIDPRIASGEEIEIEERDADEVLTAGGQPSTLPGTRGPQPGVRRDARRARQRARHRARRRPRAVERAALAALLRRAEPAAPMRVALSRTPRDVRRSRSARTRSPARARSSARVEACGVCGSDVLESWVARKVPVVLGHEIVARVVAGRRAAARRAVAARGRDARRDPPPRAVRRVPALPPRPRDALRARSARRRSIPAASPSACAYRPS